MKKYNFITQKFLIKQYTNNKKPIATIANELKCSNKTIRNRLIKYNIHIRTYSEVNSGVNNPMFGTHPIFTEEHKRKIRENHTDFSGKNHPRFDENKYNIIKEFLIKEYVDNKKSIRQIAEELNSSQMPIYDRLKKYNISRRTIGESRKGKPLSQEIRKNISLGHGGTGIPHENSKYPEEFFRIRNKILERDNYTCQLCFEYGNEAHHIDYNKENNAPENLCCLCHKCNMKVNKNRKHWTKHFKRRINKVCYELQSVENTERRTRKL